MLTQLIDIIQQHLIPLGGFGVFVASLIEEVIAPIPSAFVQMAAGFFLLPETVGGAFLTDLFLKVVFPAALGVAIGSMFIYFIGYYAGKPVIDRWGKWLGLRWKDIEAGRRKFRDARTDSALLFFLRIAPIVPSVAISVVCGMVRMNLVRYLVWTFFGTFVRATFLAMIGWQAGELYQQYADIIDRFENMIWLILGGLLLIYLIYRFVANRKA